MTYEVEEVLTRKDDPLYPRTVFRIKKKGRRLMETNSLERGENPSKYKWVEYEEYLMSDYLTERAAKKMLEKRLLIDNKPESRGLEIWQETYGNKESSTDQNS